MLFLEVKRLYLEYRDENEDGNWKICVDVLTNDE